MIGKENGTVRWMTGFDTRTPGFEVNDAGYQRQADRTIQFAWMGLRFNKPGRVFRRANVNVNQSSTFDWGGNRQNLSGNVNTNLTLVNYWSVFGGLWRGVGGWQNGASNAYCSSPEPTTNRSECHAPERPISGCSISARMF